jgi:hypothetical protein
MLLKEILVVAVCEKRTKHTHPFCGQISDFRMLKQVVHIES